MKKIFLIILLLILLFNVSGCTKIKEMLNMTSDYNPTNISEKENLTIYTKIPGKDLFESHHPMNIYTDSNLRIVKIDKIDVCTFVFNGNTNSMNPTIAEGNWFCYENYDNFKKSEKLEVGDIIVFNYVGENKPIIHRIILIFGDFIVTRGDHNDLFQIEIITEEDIVGVVRVILLK